MQKSLSLIPVLLLFAALVAASAARAGDVTYTVDQKVGDGSITGTITTNGTMGKLNYIEIDSFSFGVSDDNNSMSTISSGKEGKTPAVNEIQIGGSDLTASASALTFNFSGTDNGYLAFENTLPNGAIEIICWGNGVWPCSFKDPQGIAIYNLAGDGQYTFQGETGNQVIASVASTPEPATSGLLLLGLGLLATMTVLRSRIVHVQQPV